ncbi:MAG: MBL fold metallo-hydrolase [Anaerolineales bacterium]|nr:MBL fold metallo-hydrolase [Anaerolineales bacterium]
MYVKFWGTRGSIPTSLPADSIKQKIRQALTRAAGLNLADEAVLSRYLERLPFNIWGTAGGNTPCLEVRAGDQLLILDAGSGLRLLGLELMQNGFAAGNHQADILITHTHWDHIQGFPFFRPAFVPDNQFIFHSPFPDLANRLSQQQQSDFFPVPVSYMSATLAFNTLTENQWYQLGNFRVYAMRLIHPGVTYGYRVEAGNSSLVWATDSEYKQVDRASTENYVEFFKDADLLVFDAQYTLSEVLDKPDWGHSSALMGAEFAHRAGVKRLALAHHDPTSPDEKIWADREQAEAYLRRRQNHQPGCEVLVAYDGLSLEI